MADVGLRGLRVFGSLLALVALTVYGLRQHPPARLSYSAARKDPAAWTGRDVVVDPVRVVQVLPDGGFVGEFWGRRAVFRGVSDVVPGQEVAVRFAFEPGAREIRVKDALPAPRGRMVLLYIIFGVSIVTLLVVVANVRRRWTWSLRAGVAPRKGEVGWRTS